MKNNRSRLSNETKRAMSWNYTDVNYLSTYIRCLYVIRKIMCTTARSFNSHPFGPVPESNFSVGANNNSKGVMDDKIYYDKH